MKYFSPGNLLVGALLKTKLQKIYPRLVDNKLRIAIAYLMPKRHLSNNVGIASLQKSTLSKREDFIAFNNVNSRHDVDKSDRLTLKTFNLTICLNDQNSLPVKRLGVNNLEIYVPETLGFAKTKSNCTERKILSKILRIMKKRKIPKSELKGTLYLYTKLEPCAYCMTAISEFIELTGTKVYLLYEELIFEIVRDNLSTGPRFITNIIEPTDYNKLFDYDPNLANKVRSDYAKRGKTF